MSWWDTSLCYVTALRMMAIILPGGEAGLPLNLTWQHKVTSHVTLD